MNFKTTIILIILLAAVGAWLFFTKQESSSTSTTPAQANLLDLDSKDVTKIVVTAADGSQYTLEKSGADWQLTEPVKAAADTFEVDSLVRGFTEAKTRGEVDASSANAAATGLAKPRYKVQLITPLKTVKVAVGEKSAIGDNLYVQLDGKSQAELIPTDVSDKLEKGADAYRKMNLVTATSDQIKQISITSPQQKIVLQKQGSNWQVTEPSNMPADESAASDLVFALTGLKADTFVDPKTVPPADTARPQLTVAFSSDVPVAPPATAPSTQPTWTIIEFGAPEDLLKKSVYVTLHGTNIVATVPMTSLDSFKKKPLDLRDKKVVDFDPNVVTHLSIATDLPSTTQPTTKPAINTLVTIDKRKVAPTVMGPAAPTTSTTQAAATQPTTAPAQTKYMVSSPPAGDADDSKVTTLLAALHPLRADKYLEAAPATQPTGRYTLTVTTTGPFGTNIVDHQIALVDPGHDQPLIGSYNGLIFETSRTLLSDLEGTWVKK